MSTELTVQSERAFQKVCMKITTIWGIILSKKKNVLTGTLWYHWLKWLFPFGLQLVSFIKR